MTLVTLVSPIYQVEKLVLLFCTLLWLLKEEHQGLLKLHVHLGRFQSEEKIGLPPKGEFCLKRKNKK